MERLTDKYYGYQVQIIAEKYALIYGVSNNTDIILFNLQTNEYDILVSDFYLQYIQEISTGYFFINRDSNTTGLSYFLNKETLELTQIENIGNRRIDYQDGNYVLFTGYNLAPRIYDLNNKIATTITNLSGEYFNYIDVDDNITLLSYSSNTSTTSYLGIWKWNKLEKSISKIYNEGCSWKYYANCDNCVIIRSPYKPNILKYNKEDSNISILLSGTKYNFSSNDISKIEDGVLLTNTVGSDVYIYNDKEDSLRKLSFTSPYSFQHFPVKEGVFLGTSYTSSGYFYETATDTVKSIGYITSHFSVFNTRYGYVLKNINNGILISKFVDGKISTKIMGAESSGSIKYISNYETDDYYYFYGSNTGGGGRNIIKVSKTDYNDCKLLLKSNLDTFKSCLSLNDNLIFYNSKFVIYNEKNDEVVIPDINQFLGDTSISLWAKNIIDNKEYLSDGEGIIDLSEMKINNIPNRKYIWNTYTFDSLGATNFLTGEKYSFKIRYDANSFKDYYYAIYGSNTTNFNTKILVGLNKTNIIICEN